MSRMIISAADVFLVIASVFARPAPMATTSRQSTVSLAARLRVSFLVLALALTLIRTAAAQQIGGAAGGVGGPMGDAAVGYAPTSEPVPFADVLQRLQETEARLRLAEERLAENEERWQRFAGPGGNDVESFAPPGSKPRLQFSSNATRQPSWI